MVEIVIILRIFIGLNSLNSIVDEEHFSHIAIYREFNENDPLHLLLGRQKKTKQKLLLLSNTIQSIKGIKINIAFSLSHTRYETVKIGAKRLRIVLSALLVVI